MNQKGAGLIEVLVSLFTMAVGLLGVLGMQINAMGSNQRAEFMTEAQMAAENMINRIMVYGDNDQGANSGEYAVDTSVATLTNPDCMGDGCTLSQLITSDFYEWNQLLEGSLPSGVGIVTWNAPVYRVTVLWDQARSGATKTTCDSRNTDTHLTCFSMELRL